MKDKHLRVEADLQFFKSLQARLKAELPLDDPAQRLKIIGKFLFYSSWSLASYLAIWMVTTPLLLVLAYLSFGFASMLMAFNFAHDLSHDALFAKKSWNNAGYTLLYSLVGAHAEAWKRRHVDSHHFAPNVKDYDTDLQITTLIRVEPSAPCMPYHRYQHWYAPLAYSSYSLYWIFIKDFYIYVQDTRAGRIRWSYHFSFWLQKVFYLGYTLLLPLFFSSLSPLWFIAAFLLMHLSQSVFLLFTFFITHHVGQTQYFETDADGYIQSSWLNNQLCSSNDFYPFSEPANFIFGGFNNHIAHHLFPHIHHIHYPRLNRILYAALEERGFTPNRTGFFSGARAHLRHLRDMGQVQPVEASV